MPVSESTALDQVTVGWEDIYLKTKLLKETKHLKNSLLYKLNLHRMKVNIKWSQN